MSTSDPTSAPEDEDEGLDEALYNGLRLERAPFGLERVFDYEPGGHHPVHLGDTLGDRYQYRVVHKLGTGGLANVWFCRDLTIHDTTRYVALKILMAEASTDDCPELLANTDLPADEDGLNHIVHALDHFRVQGPNGSHLCFVYPVLGPAVSIGLSENAPNHDEILRNICRRMVEAMDYLHSHGVCHGGKFSSALLGLHKLTPFSRFHAEQHSSPSFGPRRPDRSRSSSSYRCSKSE